MAKFSRRHYVEVGAQLRRSKASDSQIKGWATMFARDNPRFDKDRFFRFTKTGAERRPNKTSTKSRRKTSTLLRSLGL